MPTIEPWYPGTRLDPRGRSATSFYGVTEEPPSDAKQHSSDATGDNTPEHSDDKTTADGVLDGVCVDPVGHVGSVPLRVPLSSVMDYRYEMQGTERRPGSRSRPVHHRA